MNSQTSCAGTLTHKIVIELHWILQYEPLSVHNSIELHAYIIYIFSGPSLFMVLSRPDAVTGWRALMGPTDPSKAKDEQPDRFDHLFLCFLCTSCGCQ